MPWFKVDDDLHSHPKARRVGLAPLGLWSVSGSYSMSYKTDGFVPDWFVNGWPNGRRYVQELVAAGMWEPAEKDGESGWQFHDWADYQPLSDEIEADRDRARDRQRKRRARLRGETNADVTANVTPDVTRDSQDPVPSRPDPTTKEKNAAIAAAFDEWWTAYPKKVAKGAATKAYRAALKKVDAVELLAGLTQQLPAMTAGDPKFIPNPATWLNAERWSDEITKPKPTGTQGWWNS